MNHLTRGHHVLLAATVLAILFFQPRPLLAQAKERKNIDDLTTQELAAYKHAITLLQRSSDPTNNYVYHANLHNLFLSTPPHGCEHGNDLFFPWHRWHLANFEKALQASDPDHPTLSTKDVTIPYWNWTVPASGTRYPARFENEFDDPDPNPLWNDFRILDPTLPFYSEAYMTAIVRNNPNWIHFAGAPKSLGGSFGAFEVDSHNTMHSSYIGGTMGDPSSAAMDPIYWSFHAFIDLQWDRWQKIHNRPPTSLNSTLRGFVGAPTVNQTIHAADLGYFYTHSSESISPAETAPPPRTSRQPPRKLASTIPAFENTVAVWGGKGPFTFQFPAAQDFDRADIWLENVRIPQTISYRLRAFIHPADRDYNEDDPAGSITIWKGHTHISGEAHVDHGNAFINVTEPLKQALQSGPDATLVVTIVATPIAPAKHPKAAAEPVLRDANEEIQFKSVQLTLNGGTITASDRGDSHGH